MILLQAAAHHTHSSNKHGRSTSGEHSKDVQKTTSNTTDTKVPEHAKETPEEDQQNTPNMTEQIMVPVGDIIFNLDEYTVVQLTNLQLYIPSDFHISDADPDFSKMILSINSDIGTLELQGDYSIFINNYVSLPISSQGTILMNFLNVNVEGDTAIALTPVALLALTYDLKYRSEVITAQLIPFYNDILTAEPRLSKEILQEPFITEISKQVDGQLNYYVETYINFLLSKISVFTVGHKKLETYNGETSNQNIQIGDLFDELLLDVKTVITETDKDIISISSFHRNFSEKLESTYINGTFSAEEGWISGLSGIERFSNVSLLKNNSLFILSAGIDFTGLEMGYNKYNATFLKTEVKGEMEGTFLHKKMVLKIAMHPREDGTCTSSLNELKVLKMNGYRIKHITNIGSLDWLERRINNWLVGYFHTRIVHDLEKELTSAIHKSLSRFDCGEYVPHLKILE
ncbi:hypothetical protein C0J52_12989 [Blattella germanica]|nr:hypothetical protein C0J52_12989 [Blattella germanica]